MKSIYTAFSALALTLAFAGNAQAEISRRDQDRAAERVQRQAARDHEEVARGWQKWHDGAERVRDGAIWTFEKLNRMRK